MGEKLIQSKGIEIISGITYNREGRLRILSVELRNVFTMEEIRREINCWKRYKNFLSRDFSPSAKNSYFNRVCGLCLADPNDQKLLNKFRKTGLRRMNLYLMNTTRKEIQSKDVKLLTWSCLSLFSFFFSKRQENECTCFKENKTVQSKSLFRNAMYLVLPEKQDEVIKFTIRYITLTSQWDSEEYNFFVFQELMTIVTKPELLLAKVIKQIEINQREEAIKEAVEIASTLSNILEHAYWDKYLFNHTLHNCFNTLLKVYLLCNAPTTSKLKIDTAKFRIIIKTCIKYFITNIKDNKGLVSALDSMAKCLRDETIIEEDRIELLELIAFCAQKHHTKFLKETFTPDLLELLLRNFFSNNKIIALTAQKIFHHLLDRHGNEINFTEPLYFFKGRCNFVVNYDCSNEDIQFFKRFSGRLLDGIKHCFQKFYEKYALVTCYLTLCLILVEIPEPVVTINIIHVLITIQNYTLKNNELTITMQAHIQSIISSLMSLICVIHEEEVHPLKKYVEEVIRFRTENSPHLLPPLQNKYTVAGYHTTDYHEQLYFIEEEVLYALQRCWLSRRVQGSR